MNRHRFSLLILFLYGCSFFEDLYSLAPSSVSSSKFFTKILVESLNKNIENHWDMDDDIMIEMGDQSINLEERMKSLKVEKDAVSPQFFIDCRSSRWSKFSSFYSSNISLSYGEYISFFIEFLKQYKENNRNTYSMEDLDVYKKFNPLFAKEYFQYWETHEELILDMIRSDQLHLIYSIIWWTVFPLFLYLSFRRFSAGLWLYFGPLFYTSVSFYGHLLLSLNRCTKDIVQEYHCRKDQSLVQKKIFLRRFRDIVHHFYDHIDEIYEIECDPFVQDEKKILVQKNYFQHLRKKGFKVNHFDNSEDLDQIKMEIMNDFCEAFYDFDKFFDHLFKKKKGKQLDAMSVMDVSCKIEKAILSDKECPLNQLLFKIFKIEMEETIKFYTFLKFPLWEYYQNKCDNLREKCEIFKENQASLEKECITLKELLFIDAMELQKNLSISIKSIKAYGEKMDQLRSGYLKEYEEFRELFVSHFNALKTLKTMNDKHRKSVEELFKGLIASVNKLVFFLDTRAPSELVELSA